MRVNNKLTHDKRVSWYMLLCFLNFRVQMKWRLLLKEGLGYFFDKKQNRFALFILLPCTRGPFDHPSTALSEWKTGVFVVSFTRNRPVGLLKKLSSEEQNGRFCARFAADRQTNFAQHALLSSDKHRRQSRPVATLWQTAFLSTVLRQQHLSVVVGRYDDSFLHYDVVCPALMQAGCFCRVSHYLTTTVVYKRISQIFRWIRVEA